MRLRRLEPILRRALAGPCRVPRGASVLVAVSGGADSTALLLGLCRLAPEFDLAIRAATLHHGLRGAEADSDLEFVRKLCARHHLPLIWGRWNTRERMRERGLHGQAGLRALRRQFLVAAANHSGARFVATAHTADDQLETVLFRLARGSGLPGLAGMSPRAGRWIKPLLEATRTDIEADLAAAQQEWREDSSNLDLGYARNRIRLRAIPALIEALDPATTDPVAARQGLARRASGASIEIHEARQALAFAARRQLRAFAPRVRSELALDLPRLRRSTPALRRAVIREAWSRLLPHGPGLTRHHFTELLPLIQKPRFGARVTLPCGWNALCDRGVLRLCRRPVHDLAGALLLGVPGRVSFGRCSVQGSWTSGSRARARLAEKSGHVEYFAADALEGGLELRAARADDVFVPFGRQRSVRVGSFMKKQPVSSEMRSHPTVLADAGGILWVIGVRRSARAPVSPGTRRVLRVHAESHD